MRGSHKYYLVAFVAMMLLSGCVSMRYYDYVESDPPASIEIIQALKNDTIVVALSTYKEEEDIYKGAIRTASNKKKYQKKLDELIEVRRVEVSDMIKAFEEHFTFCEVLYMPDSLVHKFEDGEEGVFFLNYNGQLDPSITYSNRSPIKILRPSYTEWHVKIGNKSGKNMVHACKNALKADMDCTYALCHECWLPKMNAIENKEERNPPVANNKR